MSDIKRIVYIPLVFTIPESNALHNVASRTPVEMLDTMMVNTIVEQPLFVKFLNDVTARNGQEDTHPEDAIKIEVAR